MSARLTFTGMAELRASLRRLPEDLRDEAASLVLQTAAEAKAEIMDAYPVGPGTDDYEGGNLRKGVRTEELPGSRYGIRVIVKSTAQHAFIFERGTKVRKTALGYNRGPSPEHDIFVPIMQRKRREMNDGLKDLLTRNGLTVRG